MKTKAELQRENDQLRDQLENLRAAMRKLANDLKAFNDVSIPKTDELIRQVYQALPEKTAQEMKQRIDAGLNRILDRYGMTDYDLQH